MSNSRLFVRVPLTGKRLTYAGEQEFEKINNNLWITDVLAINGRANFFSSVFPKIAVCEARKLSFCDRKLSFDEFKFLTCSGNVKYLNIEETFINHENGDAVYIDSILKCVPNVEIFKCFNSEMPAFPLNSVYPFQNINTSKMVKIDIHMFSYSHFEKFFIFMKENPHIQYRIQFDGVNLSASETQKLRVIVQEIIDTGMTEFCPPYIKFDGQTSEQLHQMVMSNQQFIHVPLSDLPSDVLKWMKINAKPKMLLKLMKCCKYFQHFPEFPYFVVKEVQYGFKRDNWLFQTLDGKMHFYEGTQGIENIEKKLWITEILVLSVFSNLASCVIPKISVCDIKSLSLQFQNLAFNEFKFLTASGNVIDLFLRESTIKYENDEQVFIDSIFKCVPNVETFNYFNNRIPIFSLTSTNAFQGINTSKQNPKIEYEIYIVGDGTLSNNEAKIVEKYVQKTIDSGITEYPPPYIRFDGQTPDQRDALRLLLRNFNEKTIK
uniref:F-box domain-containing protein n=1 Tax=Panagrolaimus davidi TaxID=227884 RepID=A0A914Q472_9BILA